MPFSHIHSLPEREAGDCTRKGPALTDGAFASGLVGADAEASSDPVLPGNENSRFVVPRLLPPRVGVAHPRCAL